MKSRKIKVVDDNSGRKKIHSKWDTNTRISHDYLPLETSGIIFSRNDLGGNNTSVGSQIK